MGALGMGRAATRELVAAALIFAVFVVALFAPVVFENRTSVNAADTQPRSYPWRGGVAHPGDAPRPFQSDLGTSYYPADVFVHDSLRREHELPYWDPLSFGGRPFFANSQTMLTYPPRLALSIVASPARAHDLYLMLHVWVAAIAMFALMKYFGARFWAALLSGVAWSASSYTAIWLALENYAAVLALLPLVVLCIRRGHDRQSLMDAVWAGLALGLLFLGGSPELALPAFLFTFVYAACLTASRLVTRWQRMRWRDRIMVGARPVIIVGLALAIAAVNLLPFLELRERVGVGRVQLTPAENRDIFPVTLDDLLRVFVPPRSSFYSTATFAGTIVGLLAVVGFFTRRRGAGLGRGLVVVMALALTVPPVTWLTVTVVPPSRNLVGIGRTEFLWIFGVVVLGGLGLDAVLDRVGAWASRDPVRRAVPGLVAAACVAATALQLFAFQRDVNAPFERARDVLPPTPATEAIRSVVGDGPGRGRVLPVTREIPKRPRTHTNRTALPGGTAMALDLPSAGGYETTLPGSTVLFWRVVGGETPAQVERHRFYGAYFAYFTVYTRLDLVTAAGVSAVYVTPELETDPRWRPDALGAMGLRPVYRGPDGIVYAVDASPGRAVLVHDARRVRDDRDALRQLLSPGFDASRTVLLEGRPDTRPDLNDAAAGGRVRWEADEPNEMSLRVSTDRGGWLVVLDTWDPGWGATVDGRSAKVERANFNFRAVRVPPGRSHVKFEYRPVGFALGAGISIAAVSAGVALLVWQAVRGRRRPRRDAVRVTARPTARDGCRSARTAAP